MRRSSTLARAARRSAGRTSSAAAAAVVPRAAAHPLHGAASQARALSILSSLFPSSARSSSLLHDDTAAVEGAPGLFQLPNLHKPQDFYRLTAEVKAKCDALKHSVRPVCWSCSCIAHVGQEQLTRATVNASLALLFPLLVARICAHWRPTDRDD